MWICLNDAFVSVVAVPEKPDQLMVRARRRDHLKTLFPRARVITTPAPADYRYRCIVQRPQVTALLKERVQELDYTNFKNSVEDDDLHDIYLDMWFNHKKYQEEPKLR